MKLNGYKAELLTVLADAYDATTWSDAALEAALREGLANFNQYGRLRETSFTLLEDGHEHDLSSLSFYQLISISWPWSDGYRLEEWVRDWRQLDDDTIRMDDYHLQAGDVVRVVYLIKHSIDGLDGATVSTLDDKERERFLLLVGSYALAARARYFSHFSRDEAERAQINALEREARILRERFLDMPIERTVSTPYITWGRLGQ